MVSNPVSSVFFSSAFTLLLGACLLLPKNGFAAVLGDVNCSGEFDILDIILSVGWLLEITDAEDCDPAPPCETYDGNVADCGGEGECTPGATDTTTGGSCGQCGTEQLQRTCDSGCGWGGWSVMGCDGTCGG